MPGNSWQGLCLSTRWCTKETYTGSPCGLGYTAQLRMQKPFRPLGNFIVRCCLYPPCSNVRRLFSICVPLLSQHENRYTNKQTFKPADVKLTYVAPTPQADTQLAQLQASLDAQLGSLGPSARQQYADLLSEQAALLNEQQRYEEDLGELDRELATAEGEMARNPFKQRALDLQVGCCGDSFGVERT